MMADLSDCTYYDFADHKTLPETFCKYPPEGNPETTPLIIDNGSYQLRAGWSTDEQPILVFKNVIARNRGSKKDRGWDVLVGNDIADLESVRWMIRTPFDFNVVVNFSVQETIFDHAFSHLGIDTDGRICHPIVLTEAVSNPPYSRKQMSELLFEAYNVPKVAYGIDSLFSYLYNRKPLSLSENALLLTSGFQSTHVLPVVGGCLDADNAKRIDLGGYNNGAYMQRLLQLKYPKLSSVFTLTRMDQFLHEHGSIPIDYMDEIKKWLDPDFEARNRIMIRIPEKNTTGSQGSNLPSEEVILLGQKLRQMEYKLFDLECVAELEQELPDAFSKALADAGCETVEELNEKQKQWQAKIDKLQAELTAASQGAVQITEVPVKVEKHQALEILFQPSLVGYDQAGLGEVMEMTLANYSERVQEEMAKNVLVTGGNTRYKGFLERVKAELVKCRSFGSETVVRTAQNPTMDAWKGARQWALENLNQAHVWTTRSEFEEKGWDYMKEHIASNKRLRSAPSSG